MSKTTFQRVREMNAAFHNHPDDYFAPDWDGIKSWAKNILDEYGELVEAIHQRDRMKVRDALCDIQVFACGLQNKLGVDGDADMNAVIDGVMTRFVKDPEDLEATVKWHAGRGVTQTYTQGEYPTLVLKSAADQPDAPKGKFLKSASYKDTVFPPVPVPETGIADGDTDGGAAD